MEDKYVIGIDCGTTNVKAVLYNLKGEEIVVSSKENQVITHGLRSEQDMNKLWVSVLDCLNDLVDNSNVAKEQILGMGVSGQGEGLWAIDENGNPVDVAILWNDGRAYEIIEKIKSTGNVYVDIKKKVASYIKNGSTLTLIKWVKENEPEKYEKIRHIFTCKDYIRYKLTGEVAWELTDATCSCVDIEKGIYAKDIFETLDIEDALEKLPRLITGISKAGELKKDIADYLGLNENLPISGGMLDIVSAAVGLGVVSKGDSCVILGTTGMTLSAMEEYEADEAFNGWEISVDGKSYVKGMGSMSATPNIDWAIEKFFPNEKSDLIYSRIENELNNRSAGYSGILYHPHISLAGERAPFFNSKATAQILGIRQDTTNMDILHGVMEGVALSIKDCLKEVPNLKRVYVSGGGAKNKTWLKIISDVLNAQVCVTSSKELSAKGAALSVVMMLGIVGNIEELKSQFVSIETMIEPDKDNAKVYDEMYLIYKETQKAMEPFWNWRFDKMNSL